MKDSRRNAADIHAYCLPELKHLAGEKADELGIPLSELLVRALVAYVGAPPAYATVPRLPLGRPRKPIFSKTAKSPNFSLDDEKAEVVE